MRPLVLLAILAACKTEEPPLDSILIGLEGDIPASITIEPTVGTGTIAVPVRLVNDYGASVPGQQVTVSLTGSTATLQANDLILDGMGYGVAKVDTTGPGVFTITSQNSPDGAVAGTSGTGWAVGALLPVHAGAPFMEPGLGLVGGGSPSHVATGTGGVAVAVDKTVWWQSTTPGLPATRALSFGVPVDGMWSAEVDSDGVNDLVVWAGTEVVVVRGHALGNYAWGKGWRAESGSIVAVVVDDFNGDRLDDVTIAVNNGQEGQIELLLGNGVWGFEALDPLVVDFPIYSATAADEKADGAPDVTVLSAASGTMRRFRWDDVEGWGGGSPADITGYEAGQGARLLPTIDMDADGKPELVLTGDTDSALQDLVWFTIDSLVTKYTQAFGPYGVALADTNGDGGDDILALENDVLHAIVWDQATSGFVVHNTQGMGATGPISTGDVAGSPVMDVLAAQDGVVNVHLGELAVSSTSGEAVWTRKRTPWTTFGTDLVGDVIPADMDGDGRTDFLGVRAAGEDMEVVAWRTTENDAGGVQLVLGGSGQVNGTVLQDIVQCEERWVWALSVDGASSVLHKIRIDVDGAVITPNVRAREGVTGSVLGCGLGPDGEQSVVVSTPEGAYTVLAPSLEILETGALGAIGGITLADTNGDGLGEVVGCAAAGCSVVGLDADGDGSDEVYTGGGQLTVESQGAVQPLAGSGTVSIGDIDADGRADLLVAEPITGRIAAYRAAAGQIAWPLGIQSDRALSGRAHIGDINGDGWPELIVVNAEGDTVVAGATQEPGAAPVEPDTGGDSGGADSGL